MKNSCELTLAGQSLYPWTLKCAFDSKLHCERPGANVEFLLLLAKILGCTIKQIMEFNSTEDYANAVFEGHANLTSNIDDFFSYPKYPLSQISASISFYKGVFLTGNFKFRHSTPFWYLKPYKAEVAFCFLFSSFPQLWRSKTFWKKENFRSFNCLKIWFLTKKIYGTNVQLKIT